VSKKLISETLLWRVVAEADSHCLRDRVIVHLLLTRGLRTGEVCSLKAENVDFDAALLYVLDSKKKRYFPIPVNVKTLNLLGEYLNGRSKGYVFLRMRKQNQYKNKPLTVQAVWEMIKRMGESAGVKHWNPRMFRRHLAAFWMQKAKGELQGLQAIMRHGNPQVTWEYGNQFVFVEDIRGETDRVEDNMLSHGGKLKKEVLTVKTE
jgi:integrase/recombinase XerD